jgi:hypothetical protein
MTACMHGILVVPYQRRLRRGVKAHFDMNKELYVKTRLLKLDVRNVEPDVHGVVDYAFKGITRRRFGFDDVLILPRALI